LKENLESRQILTLLKVDTLVGALCASSAVEFFAGGYRATSPQSGQRILQVIRYRLTMKDKKHKLGLASNKISILFQSKASVPEGRAEYVDF
jgi:hypothetical protein